MMQNKEREYLVPDLKVYMIAVSKPIAISGEYGSNSENLNDRNNNYDSSDFD